MTIPHLRPAAAAAAAALMWGCATAPAVAPPEAPQVLRAPAGETAFVEALATGVQIYECARKADGGDTYEWAFRAPEAILADRAGRTLGKHYAGPTWESADGSTVVGDVVARDAGPDPAAIPWLLLKAKSTAGAGVFSAVRSVQRVQTAGGNAPAQGCGPATAGQRVRVPYTATYYFYRAGA